jgi:predicted glycosyltransferase
VTGRPALLLYCQHSLGVGHLKRSWALAAALARDFRVVLISGGASPRDLRPPHNIEIVGLPALAQHPNGLLFVVDGTASVDETRGKRIRILADAYDALRPAVVVVELFPFGRRKFAGEILTLLDRARRWPHPIVATSVRDLLVDRGTEQQAHDDRVAQILDRYFDTVLVHADPSFATLDETFRPAAPVRLPVHHTGFVVGDAAPREVERTGRILVSGGGGRFGERLYLAAIDAHDRLGRGAPPMTIVGGPLCPEETLARIRSAAVDRAGIEVVTTVDDLGDAMRASAISVSQCGYNTALDVLRAGVPALVVPFADNGDSEQSDRARRLERLGAVRVLEAGRLRADHLATAIRATFDFVPSPVALDLGGAAASARILSTMHAARAPLPDSRGLVWHERLA